MRARAWPKPQVRFLPPRNSHTLVFVLCPPHAAHLIHTPTLRAAHTHAHTHAHIFSHPRTVTHILSLIFTHSGSHISLAQSHTLTHCCSHSHSRRMLHKRFSPIELVNK